MDCNVASSRMHDYLDGDLPREHSVKLKAHLLACPSCRARYEELERTEAFVQAALSADKRDTAGDGVYDSDALTARVMNGLPKRRPHAFTGWLRNHPAITVAAVFALVMLSSFLTMWEQDSELIVRGTNLDQVVIAGNTVTIPAGAQVKGDLTVENGTTEVYGKIDGNLTVIDGSLNLASTAKVLGNERTINQALDWFWYKVTSTVNGLAS